MEVISSWHRCTLSFSSDRPEQLASSSNAKLNAYQLMLGVALAVSGLLPEHSANQSAMRSSVVVAFRPDYR
jgi:hypothetical protein